MSETMSVEACRQMQSNCSAALYRKIDALQESQQRTEIAVAKIAGSLGLNGGAPHPHHRDSEESERMHKRATDLLAAMEAATMAMIDRKPGDGITLPRWAVYSSAAVLLLIVILAAFAGERSLPVIFEGMRAGKAAVK